MTRLLNQNNIKNISEIIGLRTSNVQPIENIERDIITLPYFDRNKCRRCLRCYLSCKDSGHQTINFDNERRPVLVASNRVGFNLCIIVCLEQAIVLSNIKINK
ncbi:MAG: 4Fe-4S dicluster-binding protein [Candidatus Onthovivens sp.]|nr:4Fe-4S dicluster-binding protein [Candidatus Onthovivens sp.]